MVPHGLIPSDISVSGDSLHTWESSAKTQASKVLFDADLYWRPLKAADKGLIARVSGRFGAVLQSQGQGRRGRVTSDWLAGCQPGREPIPNSTNPSPSRPGGNPAPRTQARDGDHS
jgi:hypothetical protein